MSSGSTQFEFPVEDHFTMVSYGWNFEDVLLERALSGVANGFYVDAGAGHPVNQSVTKHFYDKGWCGIDIEPRPDLAEMLRAERPRDIVLEAAVSDRNGDGTLHASGNWEVSTLEDSHASANETASGETYAPQPVSLVRLEDVWVDHVGERTVDFLKIDVEGHEHRALAGIDLTRMRPRVLVIESLPLPAGLVDHQTWEPPVLASGYVLTLFDGVNRYYVRDEDAKALLPALSVPVNATDRFLPATLLGAAMSIARQVRTDDASSLETTRALAHHVVTAFDALLSRVSALEKRLGT